MNLIYHAKLEIERNEYNDDQAMFVANAFYHHANGNLSGGYNVEFLFDDEAHARELVETMADHEILPKLTVRNERYTVQLTTAECMCNLFALIGANQSLLELNNEIALRDLRNNTNRRINFESANLEKQIQSGIAQVERIKELDLEKLAPRLRQTALMRLENPDASLEELAKMLGLTKSGLANRFRQIFR